MFKTIVTAVDDSEPADKAVDLAIRIALDNRSDLILLHVLDLSHLEVGIYVGEPVRRLVDPQREQAKQLLKKAAATAAESGVKVRTLVREGTPAQAILDVCAECSADLVVVGSHGRRGLDRAIMGSTAEAVARRATLPVLIAR